MEDYKLIELIEKNVFSELSTEEQIFVEGKMSKEEFDAQFLLVKKTKESFVKEVAEIPLDTNLLKQLKEAKKSNKKGVLPVLFRYPAPHYFLGLVGLLFCFVLFYEKELPKEVIVYRESEPVILRDTIMLTDTIYRIKEKEDIRIVRNKKTVPKSVNPNKTIFRTVVFEDEKEYKFDSKQLEEQKIKVGTSNSDRNDLAQFLGVNI